MTIKRQWLLVLILSAVLSVIINTFLLSSLINNYYIDNSIKNYQRHYEQIEAFAQKALKENYTGQQLNVQFETHLIDPIIGIRLFDVDGNLLAHVSNASPMMNNTMRNHMMNQMMGVPSREIDSAEILDSGAVLGTLEIVKYSSAGNTIQTRMFAASLIGNSIKSFFIVLFLMLVIGLAVSKRMSRDLTNTAAMATNIDLGDKTHFEQSKVREIRSIQQSLETLQSKLRLRQVSRKRLLDELVHQTRTPLTILKTHLEGFEDGIITMTPEEIKTCEAQVDSITAMIANMSAMIDAEKNPDNVEAGDLDVGQLLKQITGALELQFQRKQIALSLQDHGKYIIQSDKSMLSQIIYNILTNAYKFTDAQGTVSVSYGKVGDGLQIIIEDTGRGIGREQIPHLFEAYYRGPDTAGIPGEGIGLYVVKENLDLIHGQIRVESEAGQGSRFIITLPDRIA